jgi:hypothetical protein
MATKAIASFNAGTDGFKDRDPLFGPARLPFVAKTHVP